MSQDNKKSMVMYQGDGSNNVFAVPMTKGKYGTISVAFVRRGLDNYEYSPTTWTLNGGLFAWADTSGNNFYTNTDIPAVGATVYNQYGVDTGYTVSAVNGTTITITDEGSSVLSRNSAGDVDENTLLTWTGDVLNVGDYIVIERTTVRKQPYEFPNNQKHIERSDDNLERQIQEVADAADRALKLDPTYSIDSGKMNPVDWLQTILRSRDLSVRELRFIDGQLCYSTVDPESAEAEKTWTPVPNAFGFTSLRYVEQEVDGIKYRWIEAQKDGAWFPVAESTDVKAQQALDNSETAVSTANDAKAVADGIDAKAQQALDNSETAVSTANDAKAVADGIDAEISNLQNQIDENALDIEALQGAGGALNASNFNTATPTQETLTKYAVDQIWPGNTNWAWNAASPAASTFTSADGVSRTAAEIFNSTWVNNTYDDHRWQLTNTQNTTPKVFEWADVGRDIVSVATATTAGIVRVGSGSQMVVNPTTGDISLDGTKAESIRGTIGAVATNQGTANAGKVLTVGDDGNIELADGASGASGAGRNIGDIFWTTRTDSALNGAVEANGSQYNFADVNGGDNNVQALLDSGALPSVSIAEFDAKVASDGGCDSFGYNLSGTFYGWDSEYGAYYTKSETPQVGDDLFQKENGVMKKVDIVYGVRGPDRIEISYDGRDAVRETSIDETITSTYFKVPKKLGRVLVRSQKPTADNNYTWYNLYSDGWVEQGGLKLNQGQDTGVVALPIVMSDINYTITLGAFYNNSSAGIAYIRESPTVNSFLIKVAPVDGVVLTANKFYWQVSGYAIESEYTKDKWDYQNVQVERPMVQLFNSATDEAVAKCTEVLSDVAGLKLATDGMIDYVVESQEPTEANGYTWYRLYKSGWVEQGGDANAGGIATVVLPIIMSNANYSIVFGNRSGTYEQLMQYDQTTTGFKLKNSNSGGFASCYWQVSGMSAQGSN